MRITETSIASDGTIKYAFLCGENERIEACVIFFDRDNCREANICISCQIGCRMACDFCIAGHRRFIRNLSKDEIVREFSLIMDAIYSEIKDMRIEVTYMGSGEPLNNLPAVLSSASQIKDSYPNIARINISTILPSLEVETDLFSYFSGNMHIQFSLHATNEAVRRTLFRKDLPSIERSLRTISLIADTLNDRFCINYVLFAGINDSIVDAEALSIMAKRYNCYVKVSEYAEINETNLRTSRLQKEFYDILHMNGIDVRQFVSHGIDVNAACGNFYRNYLL